MGRIDIVKATGVGCALAWAVGCASAALPATVVVDAKSQISAAEAVGARSVPEAALHLKMATDEEQGAEALMGRKDYERARTMLERSKVDAELALMLTRDAELTAQARSAEQRVADLERGNE